MRLSPLALKGLAGVLTLALTIVLAVWAWRYSKVLAVLILLLVDLASFANNYGLGLDNGLTAWVFKKLGYKPFKIENFINDLLKK